MPGTVRHPMPPGLESGFGQIAAASKRELGMRLGTLMEDLSGRLWRLAKAGAVALTARLNTIGPAMTANHTAMTWVSGGAKGSQEVVVTLGNTATTAQMYEDGSLIIESGVGAGQRYAVDYVEVVSANGNARIRLASTEKFTTTLTATSKLTLKKNPYDGTLIAAADATQVPTGCPLIAVSIGYYYASLTGGLGPCLAGAALTKGEELTFDNGGGAVAGALIARTGAADTTIARCEEDSIADIEYGEVEYMIDR